MVIECGEEDGEHGEVGKAEWMRKMECGIGMAPVRSRHKDVINYF